jgi:hypothetical protein
VLEKLRDIHHALLLEHLISNLAFGGLLYPKREESFRLS